jgi:pectinesterase
MNFLASSHHHCIKCPFLNSQTNTPNPVTIFNFTRIYASLYIYIITVTVAVAGRVDHLHITMPKPAFSFILFLLLLSLFLALVTSAQSSTSAACKSTLYPKLCRSILSTIRYSPSDPYGYGKFSVKQCLKQARKMSKSIDSYLSQKRRSSMGHAEVGALDDCRQLSQLNVEYLESISAELKSAESLNDEVVEQVQTLLSAIVTNQLTCYDGLEDSESSIASALSEPLNNVTQLYSVSLGLVTHALDRNLKRNKRKKGSEGGFPTMVHPVRERLESLIKVSNF